MSKSGIESLSGFKNLSNKSPCSIGSSAVMPIAKATKEPAPDPLPGPTGTSLFFDHSIKS